ncbi:MAG: STAS domain-containing protein [Spirochaetota bacterium]
MADIQVDVSYSGNNNEVAIISAKGFIDTTTAPELEKKLEEQLALNKYNIIVDLGNIDYVSSAGWGVFVSEIREIRENNGDLVLANMSPDVYDVYELMEFSSILKSFDSLEEAKANFTGEKPKARPSAGTTQKRITSPSPASTASRQAPSRPAVGGEERQEPKPSEPSEKTPSIEEQILSRARSELGRRILKVIIENPYFETKEITKALKMPQYGGQKAKGREVKKELKAMELQDKQKRFEVALKARK